MDAHASANAVSVNGVEYTWNRKDPFALSIETLQIPKGERMLMLAILIGGMAAGLLPACRAYRMSLADGMMVRT